MHQNKSNNIFLLIPLVKHNFCSILFIEYVQSWQFWQNEVQDEKLYLSVLYPTYL